MLNQISLLALFLFLCISSIHQEEAKPILASTKVELGQQLFFDTILSLDQSISCASCHQPQFAFADSLAFSNGVGGKKGIRNTPSVMNMAFRPYFFYDGRVATLEEQALVPIENPIEMHLNFEVAIKRINKDENYILSFEKIYASLPDSANVLNALAEFQRSLESNGSAPHDQWINGLDDNAMSVSQIKGRELFLEKAKCFDCHFSPDFTGDEFRNIGLYDGKEWLDRGRFEITKDSADLGKFKVPGLRNVALTAPYMHNGQFKSLEEVVAFYSNPYEFVANPINIDSLMIEPLNLSKTEQMDLVNFLHSLTDETFTFTSD